MKQIGFEEIMTENCSKFMKDKEAIFRKSHKPQIRINIKKSTPRHIVVKPMNNRKDEKHSEARRQNLKGTRLLADFKRKDKKMEDNEIASSNYSGGENENSKPGENIL